LIWEKDITYEARVAAGEGWHRMYFSFSNDKRLGQSVSVGYSCSSKRDVYFIGTSYEVHHVCPEGSWILLVACNVWRFKGKDGSMQTPTISLANEEPEFRGKHPEVIIEYDMPSKSGSLKDVEKTMKWYNATKKMFDICTTEGGNDMSKSLFHIILFNKETETIDYKVYVPAKDKQEATMTVAQNYGKYDSKVHLVIIKYIDGSDYEKK